MGSETLVTLEYRAQRLVARVAGDRQFDPGQTVYLRLPPDRVLLFATATRQRIHDSDT
jgi:ABC-type sugar transport system ATPase subunit